MSELTEHAKQKLQEELIKFSGAGKEKAVSKPVCRALTGFCEEEWFAQAVWDSNETLSDCCKKIMAGVRSGISDLDVYKAAANFYLPGADIKFKMEITRNRTAESVDSFSGTGGKIVSLLDLL